MIWCFGFFFLWLLCDFDEESQQRRETLRMMTMLAKTVQHPDTSCQSAKFLTWKSEVNEEKVCSNFEIENLLTINGFYVLLYIPNCCKLNKEAIASIEI